MDRPSLRRLFSACDVNKSGKIEFEDFTAVCRELNVPETHIRTLFDKFDADEDGYIDYSRFSSRFQEVSETLDLAALGAGSSPNQGSPWEDFVGRTDAAALLSDSLREQLADLYQAIHSSANTTLLQQYEEIIHSLISQSLDNRLECEQLETSIKRAEEMNNSQLAELEDDIQQQLARTEERVRDEERRKMEGVMTTMQRKHENEVADLRAAVDRLLKHQ
uniref:ras and EF-hand domain-containing protein-like n=1 Tax=Epinephelus lanceolatus TaxID=310571 RepID=UPI001444F37B|nr:ras and EF-hand domain-containing protein-like [Epinephelus lanceolatus]